MLERLRRNRQVIPSHAEKRQILHGENGFEIVASGCCLFQVAWSDVREIIAFKEDLFSYDEICVGFRVKDEDAYRIVTEEYLDFDDLLRELRYRFPGIPIDWFADVVFPAFAPNGTVLWRRS